MSVGTKALLVKVSGKITMKPKICTLSGSLTSTPTSTEIHDDGEREDQQQRERAEHLATPVPTRKPRIMPDAEQQLIDHACLTVSATIRPASGDQRAIGSDRSRSKTPLVMSVFSPTPVVRVANSAFCTMMPGSANVQVVAGSSRRSRRRRRT